MNRISVQKVKLAFNVGITGHRNITDEEKKIISAKMYSVLNFVKEQSTEIYSRYGEIFDKCGPALTIISTLAEGSDRIAAEAALDERLGFRLQCPLPMKKEDYLEDFETQASRDEFLHFLNKAENVLELDFGRDSIPTCYLNAGLVMLEHIDLLIAVWDGKEARGIGGTADIIRQAERQGIPVIWLDRGDLDRICCMYITGRHYDDWRETLKNYMNMLLVPSEEDNETVSEMLETFYNHIIRQNKTVKIYSDFIDFVSWTKRKEDKKSSFTSISAQIKNSYDEDAASYVDSFIDNYERADCLALYYADIYRTAGLMRSILPFLATIGLAIGFYWNWGNTTNLINVLGFFLQALFLFFIIELSNKNERLKWHKKYTDYRILAEIFRQLIYLAPIGYVSRGIRNTGKYVPWYQWYYRSIVRNKGIPSIKLDSKKIDLYLCCVKDQFIDEQMDYHEDRASEFSIITARLNKLGYFFFGLGIFVTVIRCLVYFLVQSGTLPKVFMGITVTSFTNMLSLLLPAIGAEFFAILGQCGFENLAQKFRGMKSRLNELENDSKYIGRSYREITAFMLTVADEALGEVSDWRLFVRSKSIKKT